MVIRTPGLFRTAIDAHDLDEVRLDTAVAEAARAAIDAAGCLVVGEPHGVRETPSVLTALASAVDARAVAFEWSYEEVDEVLRDMVAGSELDLDRLWSLPVTADALSEDGRVTAGHFALLERLRRDGRLRQAIAFDRIDPDPPPPWHSRDCDMARRLLAAWDRQTRLLVLTGGFHARLDAEGGQTLAMRLADAIPGLRTAVIDYVAGAGWSRGRYPLPTAMPGATTRIRLATGSPAVVPGSPGV